MSRGYIGQRTRKRSRYRLLFFFLILLIGFIIFFANHIMDPNEDLEEIDEFIFNDEDSVSIQKLETELLGLKQRLILREKLISSLKNQIKALEDNNNELIKTIKTLSLENKKNNITLQNNNRVEIEQSQKIIDKLNQEIKNIKDNYISIKKEFSIVKKEYDIVKKESVNIKNQISILKNNNNTLELQKNIAISKFEELKQKIIEKDKLIKEMKDKIHH